MLANLFWAGNIVLGRGVAGVVPPIALAYIRWTGAFVIGLGFAWPHLRRDWPTLLRQWPLMLLLSATGIASYNTMSYIGLTETTALNVLLLQSAAPLVILLWAFALVPRAAQPRAGGGRARVARRRGGDRRARVAAGVAALCRSIAAMSGCWGRWRSTAATRRCSASGPSRTR